MIKREILDFIYTDHEGGEWLSVPFYRKHFYLLVDLVERLASYGPDVYPSWSEHAGQKYIRIESPNLNVHSMVVDGKRWDCISRRWEPYSFQHSELESSIKQINNPK